MKLHRWLLTGLVLLAPACAEAQQQSGVSPEDWALHQIRSSVRAGGTVDDARQAAMRIFRSADVDGGGVSESDHTLQAQIQAAMMRGGFIAQWLQRDLNGDGVVTRAETEAFFGRQARQPLRQQGVELTPTDEQVAQTIAKLAGDAMKPDADGDGTITFAEALAWANEQRRAVPSLGPAPERSVPLSLDADKDGTVSETEYRRVIDRALARADADGDGKFSAEEVAALGQRSTEIGRLLMQERQARELDARNRTASQGCDLPKPSERARILVVSTQKGQALSNVGLGGDDEAVTVADLGIDAGAEPIYLVLASRTPMIWRLSGALGRIERVVADAGGPNLGGLVAGAPVAAGPPRVGVLGVPAERVAFPARRNCLQEFAGNRAELARSAGSSMTYLVGRAEDQLFQRAAVWALRLPGGAATESMPYIDATDLPRRGPAAALWQIAMEDNPGGLVQIDAASVVAAVPARTYTLLPQAAGFAELLEQGAIRVTKWSDVIRVGNLSIVTRGGSDTVSLPPNAAQRLTVQPAEITILKKIRLPGGLAAWHSIDYVLAPGVPEPEGLPKGANLRRE